MRSADPFIRKHDNGYYYIHWTDPTPRGQRGRSRSESTGFTEGVKAQVYFGQWLLTRQSEPTPEQAFTVASLWELYYRQHVLTKNAAPERAERCWANLSAHFGACLLSEVTHDKVRQYLAKRTTGAIGKPSQSPTIRRELGTLTAAINWCADPGRKLIPKATVPHIELPDHGEPNDRWLTTDEIKRLFAAASEKRHGDKTALSRCERFLWLALETGARKTAICELTWDRVDLDTNVIHYDVPGRRQTKKKRANVPISAALRPVLLRMRRESDADLVLVSGSEVGGLVLRVAEHAGLEGVSPHVLRHTAATHMARRGVPLWKIAKILGNSLAMVERVYAKHSPDDLREAVDTITGGALEMGT